MKRIRLAVTGLLLLVCATLQAQNLKISGRVTDKASGEAVAAATVLLKGTTNLVTTDLDGKYTITAPTDGVLEFSFMGYITQVIEINGRILLDVAMAADALQLEDVVVVAYGTAKRESITGSVASVGVKNIENRQAVTSVTGVLEGATPGVMVNNTYGEPGSTPSIRIRGFTTINGSNSPLYIIDGVPFSGSISDLNPADIENISILKDASSAALYGNRASNGVVLITTKRGKSEKASFRANINQGVYTRGIAEYDRLNANEWMEMQWIGYRNYLMTSNPKSYPDFETANAAASKTLISDVVKYNIYNKADDALFTADGKLVDGASIRPGFDDLNWFDYIERLGHRQEYTLSGDYAGEKSQTYISGGYLNEKGYVVASGYSRWTGRLNTTITPKKWFKAGLTLAGTYQESDNTSDGASAFVNPFMYARNIAPIYPIYLHDMTTGEYLLDEFGNKQYDDGSENNRAQYLGRHVIWERSLDMDHSYKTTLNSQAFAEIKFLKHFTFTVKGDMSLRNTERHSYNNALIGDGQGNHGRASRTVNRYKTWTFQQQLTWAREFGLHNVDVLVAHENYSWMQNYLYGYKTTETFSGKKSFNNFTNITKLTDYPNYYKTESYLSRARYNYDNKYFAEASFRRDGSSRFHPDHRWGNFWSVGGSWIVSKENFMDGVRGIDMLKLRASYGEVGNDQSVGLYGWMALYDLTQNANLGAAYKSQNEAANIKWETAASFDIGVDLALWNRVNFTVDYFDKRSKDLLFSVYQPLSAGATSLGSAVSTQTMNLGSISNRGIEVSLSGDVISKKDFRWNLGVNFTFQKNKILSLPEQNAKEGIISGNHKYAIGHGMYDFWTYQYVGVDQLTGNALYVPDAGQADAKHYIGEPTQEDIDKERTKIDNDFLVKIGDDYYVTNSSYAYRDWAGSALPKVYGSFSTRLEWGNLSLSALFTYALGGKCFDYSYQNLLTASTSPSAMHKDLLKSWREAPAGMTEKSPDRIDPAGTPVFDYARSPYVNGTSTRFLQSGNYFIVKNITLSYNLPKRLAQKIDLSGIALNATVENLATFTALKGMNPQTNYSGSSNNYFVTARVFTLGLNIRL